MPFYVGFAVAGWLAKRLIELLQRRWQPRPLDIFGVLAEGIWTVATFVVAIIAAGYLSTWLQGRLISVEIVAHWHEFLAALPDWHLLFGQTLRDLASALVGVAPTAVATVILLPLMWLALTATVFGWREFTARDVVAGTRAEARIARLQEGADRPLSRLALLATADLRTTYLPVAQAFRLILHAGPRLIRGLSLARHRDRPAGEPAHRAPGRSAPRRPASNCG